MIKSKKKRWQSKEARGKNKQLWQIFFDDSNKPETETDRSGHEQAAGSSHGVLYRGLLEEESDSEEEVEQGAPSGGEPDELKLCQKETVLFEKNADTWNANSVQNYSKPYNAKEWESVDISPNSGDEQRRPSLQQAGARYIIRSESDLELAIPRTKQTTRCCCCLPSKSTQSETFQYYACFALSLVAASALYVAVVIVIVYGFN